VARNRSAQLTTPPEGSAPTPQTANPVEALYDQMLNGIVERFWTQHLPSRLGGAIADWIKDPENQSKLRGRLSLEGLDFFGSESGGTEALPEAPTLEATCEPSA
jgi:hypothetical protein